MVVRVRAARDILIVEVKAEGDDSNRNHAKCRAGERHFQTLNERLTEADEHIEFIWSRPQLLYPCGFQSDSGSGSGETRTRNQRLKRALLYH